MTAFRTRVKPGPGLVIALVLGLVGAPAFAQSLRDLTRWEGGRSMRASSGIEVAGRLHDGRNNKDRIDRIEAGETYVLAEMKGPGVITHMWMTFLHEPHNWVRDGAAHHGELLLRIYWDGRAEPDVEAPVGEFFASCFGRRMEVRSLPVVVEGGDSYNCFWRMPFRKSARVEIANQSSKPLRKLYYNIDWIRKDTLPPNTMCFCARYRQEYPALNGRDYLVLDADGPGYFVGMVYAVRTRSPAWWGEGDEKIYIDGESTPSIRGTGTEDYFLSAWGLEEHLGPYSGCPYRSREDRAIGAMTCCYRWHVADPIAFEKSIRVTFETFGWMSADENEEHRPHSWNEREDDFASVAFWYQLGPSRRFCEVPPASARCLPSIERVLVWGKDHAGPQRRGECLVRVQEGALWLESGGQLLCTPPSNSRSCWLEYDFEVQEKEPLRLVLELTRSYDYGTYRVSLDGVMIGELLDLYRAETDLHEFHLMDFWPAPGRHTLRLSCAGKNERSKGYRIGVNSIRLRERRPRVKALGWDREKDWREEQVLHR